MAKYTAKSRKQRIETLIARLESGRDIQARDLKLVLTSEQLQEYKTLWAEQKQIRNEPLPSGLARYQKMLHRALMWEGRAEQFGGRTVNGPIKGRVRRSQQQNKLNNKSDGLMEDAAEHLREELFANPSLHAWLDRSVECGSDGDIHIDIQDMPRVITSRSSSNAVRHEGLAVMGKVTKRECKLQILRTALAGMDGSNADAGQKFAGELAAKLAALRRAR